VGEPYVAQAPPAVCKVKFVREQFFLASAEKILD